MKTLNLKRIQTRDQSLTECKRRKLGKYPLRFKNGKVVGFDWNKPVANYLTPLVPEAK